MERLTIRSETGIRVKGCRTYYSDVERKGAYKHNAIVRLAAYEDTALTPDEINLLLNPKNDPLTLDELREMDGEPVWVTHKDGSGGRWGIVNIYPNGIGADVCSDTVYWFEDYIGTIAYRRKPSEKSEK